MKIRRYLSIILLGACLIHSLAMATDTQPANNNTDKLPSTEVNPASKDDLSAQKELFQLQLDAKKELLQKDIEAQSKRIDAFEKRIDDQTNRIGDIGAGVDRFGILITVLFVVAGLLGYRAAKKDAKDTAEQAASQWFKDNQVTLVAMIRELESKATQASQAIDDHQDKVAKKTREVHEEIEASTEK